MTTLESTCLRCGSQVNFDVDLSGLQPETAEACKRLASHCICQRCAGKDRPPRKAPVRQQQQIRLPYADN